MSHEHIEDKILNLKCNQMSDWQRAIVDLIEDLLEDNRRLGSRVYNLESKNMENNDWRT